jgi:hypothetical protein
LNNLSEKNVYQDPVAFDTFKTDEGITLNEVKNLVVVWFGAAPEEKKRLSVSLVVTSMACPNDD